MIIGMGVWVGRRNCEGGGYVGEELGGKGEFGYMKLYEHCRQPNTQWSNERR
jgi:hypothetical protein